MMPAPTTASTPAPTLNSSRRVPLDKRKRTEQSCDKCKSRKQKCRKEPGQDACRYCIVHHIECLTTQPRKKRLYGSVEGLGTRLALLESLVKGLVPDADVSSVEELRSLGGALGIPLPDASEDAQDEQNGHSDHEGDEALSLLPDQQGQVQYIGPASSFSFHLKLRTLVGRGVLREFVLFGRNPADQEPIEDSTTRHIDDALSSNGHASSTACEAPSLESLIGAFFDHINRDFPVLHETSFREAYEAWLADPGNTEPAWLCSFLCVLLLARRVARATFPEDRERLWWRRVQTLLPVVIFTSSITAVQALMLAAVHLHNTNHRDACWNLTGTAIRIAFAIGLHQDKASTLQTPLATELQKQLWWTLYAFEQMQVSSYDRPSAIERARCKISCPSERIIGMTSYCPPDYCKWFNRLALHLGSACRAPKTVKANTSEEAYVGPLSPAAGVMRDLERWKDTVPHHLRLEVLDPSPPAFQRPMLLLHGMYHYTVIVLCRAALLARASILSKASQDSNNSALVVMAESCAESGRELGKILLKLDTIGKFDAVTWWDIWYMLASSSVLVLELVCLDKLAGADVSESRIMLSQLADLAQRHRRNPYMPGTIEKFASLVPELHSMADFTNISPAPATASRMETASDHTPVHIPYPSHEEVMDPLYQQSSPNGGAYMFPDGVAGRVYPDQDFVGPTAYPSVRYDRNTQMQFMDFTINNINDWNWGDLGGLLGSEGIPNIHVNGHPPPGRQSAGPS